jgi:hypothetical protein
MPPQSLLTGAIWEAVCAIITGLVGHFTQRNKSGGDTVIAFAVLHVFGFSMFWGPTPWVYLGESFPLRVRAKSIALGSASSTSLAWFWFWVSSRDVPSQRVFFRLGVELFALVICPSYRSQVCTPFILHFGLSGDGPRTEPPISLQNRTPDYADIFRHARLWLRLRLLCNPRDQGIEFRRGRAHSIHAVIGRDLTDLGRRNVPC